MPPHNVMIKPASGNCNLRCSYCFYCDEINKRETANYGIMSYETAEKLIQKTLESAKKECTFAFQGGEPTLAGLPFFIYFAEKVRELNKRNKKIRYALQTNGTTLDRDWVAFFAKNDFLIGLSLDGDKNTHDRFRIDGAGRGSYSSVMHAAQLLANRQVPFNILTTVTGPVAKNPTKIYGFYKRNHFRHLQFIPCMEAIGSTVCTNEYSVTNEDFGSFLCKLFDLWYSDLFSAQPVSIRYFDNLALSAVGFAPDACGMYGYCGEQYVIEADGSVYPCDFYVLDDFCIGNIVTQDYSDFDIKRKQIQFIEQSKTIATDCITCKWIGLCHGGCRRDRDCFDGNIQNNRYCQAYKMFFEYTQDRLLSAGQRLSVLYS